MRVRRPVVLIASLLLLARATAAQSTTLVAPTSTAAIPAGFGNTAFLTFEYGVRAGFGSFSTVAGADAVNGWPTGYGQLPSAFWSNGINASAASLDVVQILATAVVPTNVVTLNSLDMGEWSRLGENLSIRIYNLSGTELFRQSKPGSDLVGAIVRPTVTFTPNVSAVGGLYLQFGEDTWYTGASNIRYTVSSPSSSVVPEPSTYALMTVGLGALAIGARRRRRV